MSFLGPLLGAAIAATTGAGKKKQSSFGGSANGVGTSTSEQDRIRDQMNENSKKWYETTDQAERDRLHAENEGLGNQLGGSVGYDKNTGLWSGNAAKPGGDFSYGNAPSYTGKYQNQIDELLNGILNREKFSYDATKDPLYAQYKDQYQREGQRAMKDTVGEVAANTGGLASSWATTAASQANDYYASQLSDKIPELYQLAYGMYMDDIDGQVRDLGLLNDMDQAQYGRYRDTMSDWRSDRDFAYGQYRDDISDNHYDKEWGYQVGRDEIGDGRYDTEYGDSRSDVEYDRLEQKAKNMAAAGDFSGYKALGYSDAQIKNMQDAYRQQGSSGGRTGSGGGDGYTGGAEPDYDGLYAAAWASPNPDNYISSHYKEYGFTSVSGLKTGFQQWRDEPVDNGQSVNKTSIDVMTTNVGKMLQAGRSPEYIYDALKKQGFADAVIDRIFAAAGL